MKNTYLDLLSKMKLENGSRRAAVAVPGFVIIVARIRCLAQSCFGLTAVFDAARQSAQGGIRCWSFVFERCMLVRG